MANDDREARARKAVRGTLRDVPWLFSKEGNRQAFRRWLERADLAVVVRFAKQGDADAIVVLRDYARGARGAGMAIPPELQDFALEWFVGGPPKARRGSSPKDTATRDRAIAEMVRLSHEDFGFPVYRNPAWRGAQAGPMTACRLVAKEIRRSERTVEGILRKRKAKAVQAAKLGG